MKYITIVLLFLSLSTKIHAQEGKPTKQETMDWIGKTLVKYTSSSPSYESFAYSNGVITYTHYLNPYIYKEAIYLSKILSWSYFDNGFEVRGYNSNKSVTYLGGKIDDISYNGVIRLGTGTGGYGADAFMFIDENNIRERFSKALNNLVEYNKSELPKESY